MGYAVVSQWHQIATIEWEINLILLAISLTMLVGLFFLDAYGWHLILKSLSVDIKMKSSIRIWILSSVARYLPGGIWAYAGRAVMTKQEGVNLTTTSLSMYLETILLAASSFAVGFPAILGSAGLYVRPYQAILIWGFLGICLHPKIIQLLRFIPGRIGKAIETAKLPSTKNIIALYIYYLLFWCLFSTTFCIFSNALYQISLDQYLVIGSSFALAFCIGLVVFVFPSGIGIREATLYSLLAIILTPSVSLLIAIGSRLWTTVGEALSVILVLFWKKEKTLETQTMDNLNI